MDSALWTAILAAVVSVCTALFGWLKTRDASRFRAIESRIGANHAEMDRSRARITELEMDLARFQKAAHDCLSEKKQLESELSRLERQRIEMLEEINELRRQVILLQERLGG